MDTAALRQKYVVACRPNKDALMRGCSETLLEPSVDGLKVSDDRRRGL
ncbi:MAG: hypothetical protein RMM53_01030 [Bacteroidia bacterium]|nr:hypothetical protein [Bacteroidia bacterium]MDW8332776.1 hypothetical protein [Bacteroidia bacterium]